MQIRETDQNRDRIARSILTALPDWFGIESARDAYVRFAAKAPMFVAEEDGRTFGYLALKLHGDTHAEIHSIGVLQEWHRQGVGRGLINAAEDWANRRGYRYLSVKTLAERSGVNDPAYAATRAFYHAVGFAPFEMIEGFWGPDLPCLVMLRDLG